jgi:iron(III) transport system substrate-binding protein
MMRLVYLGLGLLLLCSPAKATPHQTVFPALQTEEARLELHAAADLSAMQPLIEGFQKAHPGIAVAYTEYLTNELFDLTSEACREHRAFADIVISSSSDQVSKLANDGCARAHQPANEALPTWANWRNRAFGFTFEPAVIVYDKRAVPPDQVPKSHADLVELLRDRHEAYTWRIGTYDIAQSGIGYLFAALDSRQSGIYGRLIEAFGRSGAVLKCCTGDILDEIEAGRVKIGYNLLGSYAYRRMKDGAPIGIVLPRDYVLVLARAAMLPREAINPALGAQFLDFLLSDAGQTIVAEKSFFFAIGHPMPPGVDAPANDYAASVFRPISAGPGLIAILDQARRRRVLEEWSAAFSGR